MIRHVDANEAVAQVAHALNEVIAIYPITPASPMGEFADQYSAEGRRNLWGQVPRIVEMQSEAGAAGAVHGALQGGCLATTFTSSQGLLLMIPEMYKMAGELSPMVIHVASRAIATHALSIFGDHSDVMATRGSGFALLASGSVQEAHDFALIAQAASLCGRIPVLHFFDGFRTSHQIDDIEAMPEQVLRAMMDDVPVQAHRQRGLSAAHPILRGSSQNPDVFFQSREAVNTYYNAFPGIVQAEMDRFAALTGRQYRLFDYVGAVDAERVIVVMGSAAETAHETVDFLCRQGEKVGVLKVRLFRPLDAQALVEALPVSVCAVAVLDRCKEPGAEGEPLYKDVLTAVMRRGQHLAQLPRVVGGRYGLASKEFTPAMVRAVFDELGRTDPRQEFTIGIDDDVTRLSLDWDPDWHTDANAGAFQALFYGLGADGTVSANKNSIRIIGEATGRHVQGYFVYDSKKSGAVTISHLRVSPAPIRSSYLIGSGEADFVACHQSVFLQHYDMLALAAEGATFLVNSSLDGASLWDTLPYEAQQQLIDKRIRLYLIDGYGLAAALGLGRRINIIMQTAFFALTSLMPLGQALAAIRQAAQESYGKAGETVLAANMAAIDLAQQHIHAVIIPAEASSHTPIGRRFPAHLPAFVCDVTAPMIAGQGNNLPVSRMPVDGSFPLGTAAYEKRRMALEIPVWETDLCTHCGKCVLVCPHSVIRSKLFPLESAADAPDSFKHVQVLGKDFPANYHISYQVAPEDCTGCSLCVDICPIRDKANPERKALNMRPIEPLLTQEQQNWDYFLGLPDYDRREVKLTTIKGSMLLQPLFEFSGACEGCGETPYIRLVSQLFGDRMVVANATGCSSIYGGNLPTTPWTVNAQGRGPAWNNSLFEDNAEFGMGIRLALDHRRDHARALVTGLVDVLGEQVVTALLDADEGSEAGVYEQRERVQGLRVVLAGMGQPLARELEVLADDLCRTSVWLIGGDGWAYDIDFGGLDHVLASGIDVNILVLDTEVYSNTGGQTSKATPRGAVAKFSAAGRPVGKKDLARMAISYGDVYVAQIAYGARDMHTLRVMLEAESYPGPSLILAYSPCIAHGVDLANNHHQQQLAVASGHWPLLRYDPRRAVAGENPFRLDSPEPSIPLRDYYQTEGRFSQLWRSQPARAEQLLAEAQQEVDRRYRYYLGLAQAPSDSRN